jgi:hypothetical protein
MKRTIKRFRKKLHFYRLLTGYILKTMFKPINTSFEINRERVCRVHYVYHTCKSLQRIARLNGWS